MFASGGKLQKRRETTPKLKRIVLFVINITIMFCCENQFVVKTVFNIHRVLIVVLNCKLVSPHHSLWKLSYNNEQILNCALSLDEIFYDIIAVYSGFVGIYRFHRKTKYLLLIESCFHFYKLYKEFVASFPLF